MELALGEDCGYKVTEQGICLPVPERQVGSGQEQKEERGSQKPGELSLSAPRVLNIAKRRVEWARSGPMGLACHGD